MIMAVKEEFTVEIPAHEVEKAVITFHLMTTTLRPPFTSQMRFSLLPGGILLTNIIIFTLPVNMPLINRLQLYFYGQSLISSFPLFYAS